MSEAPTARARLAAIFAMVVFLALLGGVVAWVPLSLAARGALGSLASSAGIALAFASVGVLLAVRRTRNPIGWTLLGAGAFFVVQGVASSYLVLDYRHHGGSLPLGPLFVLLQPSWAPAIILIAVSVLIFPDARLLTGRTRWVVWGLVAVGAVWLAGAYGISISAIVEHRVRVDAGGTLTEIDHASGAWAWWNIAQDAYFIALGASLLFWVVLQATQYRKLTGERRVQQKWLISGAVVCAIGGMFAITEGSSTSHLVDALTSIGVALLAALPITIGIAIFRFQLYDVDRVISRTLSYLLLTGLIVGLYAGIISLATRALSFSSPVAVAASTLAAAAVFNPLRRRLQRLVDHRFNRARYDAEATIAAFTARLREVVDAETVRADLLRVVDGTFEPASVTFCTVELVEP